VVKLVSNSDIETLSLCRLTNIRIVFEISHSYLTPHSNSHDNPRKKLSTFTMAPKFISKNLPVKH
jgi:UV DNA damage repair endonuclease